MQSNSRKNGFTLIEAVMAITVTAIAGSALLLGMGNSLQTTNHLIEQSIATGIAQQMMDEISGVRYNASPTNDIPENSTPGRTWCDNLDDYEGLVFQPPEDRWGVPLGTEDMEGNTRDPAFCVPIGYFDAWRVEVNLSYVDENDPSLVLIGNETSDFRAVEVQVGKVESEGQYRHIVKLRRVFANVPSI